MQQRLRDVLGKIFPEFRQHSHFSTSAVKKLRETVTKKIVKTSNLKAFRKVNALIQESNNYKVRFACSV